MKLTKKQREILTLMRDGAVMTVNVQNMPRIGEMPVQPQTRYFLTDNRLITRIDRDRNVGVNGNGFVISAMGLAELAASEEISPAAGTAREER